ncbi:pyruvate dehydrogenase E1 component subunit alpha, mitochondrial [Drosophila willistoni]|nr:pyruvate dehydrogenase E1 component subunit alpha, mitochondrial [Drosophila willistoni]
MYRARRLIRRLFHFTPAQLPRPLAPNGSSDNKKCDEVDYDKQMAVGLPVPKLDVPDECESMSESMDEVRVLRLQKDFHLHRLECGPEMLVRLGKEDAKVYYRQMVAIRRLEAAASLLYKERLVRGFCHLYTGQEACAVGIKAAMRPEDTLIAGYRVHGWAYLMGVSALGVLAELTGRLSGCAKGKGGSMHMYGQGFYGGTGIVGDQVPLGAGIALAKKYSNNGGVCFALYGDGAANQGQIFECFNMACLWKLPIVFVCENNNYGMGTSAERAACNIKYYTRGDVLPGIWVNGQDILAVRSAAEFAIDHAQKRGPLLLELSTHRYYGHSMSDPGTGYRPREEIQNVRIKYDPINSFRLLCQGNVILSQNELKQIDDEVRHEVNEAIGRAKKDEELPINHLWSDVYAGHVEGNMRDVHGYNLKHVRTKASNA